MKFILLILSIFILTLSKGYSQDFTKVDNVKTFLFNLPVNADKLSIIEAAKMQFKNNIIDTFKIEANTKVYFQDTTIIYNIFTKQPLITTLKIFDVWSFDNPKSNDTTFYVLIDASYGTDKKAERKMFAEYYNLKDKFEDMFILQKPYTMYADGKIGQVINFFFTDTVTSPLFNIGWSNGGCFRDYRVSVSFSRKNSYAQQVHL
jgi:hypothetical protein